MLITKHTTKHLEILFEGKVKMRFEKSFVTFTIHMSQPKDPTYLLSLAKSVFPENVDEPNTKLIGNTYNLRVGYVPKQKKED